MTRLAKQILAAVAGGRVVCSVHAENSLATRNIEEWQVVEATEEGTLLAERSAAKPNPIIEMRGHLADGVACKMIWALQNDGRARLVTVHFA